MPAFREYTFLSTNGTTKINVRRFDPDGPACGIVQIAHGVSEHVSRYDAFMKLLAENGFIALGNDHLGHGASVNSEDELGWFAESDGWNVLVADMRKLHNITCAESPGLPYFLFGHSMGSFLTRTYIIKYPADLSGAVICGTGQQSAALVGAGKAAASTICKLKGTKHRSKLLGGMAFGSYNKSFEPRRTDYDWLTRDESIVDIYLQDPLCGFLPTAGLFRDMMTGIAFISSPENIAKMDKDLPVFFISGDLDPVGENGKGPAKAYAAFKSAGMRDVTIRFYKNCRHELLNELNKDEVQKDVLSWLEARLPGEVSD